MFGALTDKLTGVFAKVAGKKTLSEDNLSEAIREVRLALLEADVNYGVAKTFVTRVKEQALGQAVLKSVKPGQQFIKLVHDELAALMGGEESELRLTGSPAVVMLCGLQGAGKTTHAAKLAHYYKSKKVLLAACDLQRPAAIEQLIRMGEQVGADVFTISGEKDPLRVAQQALSKAKAERYELLILDTAGRLHIDDALMQELGQIKRSIQPQEILFVANAATGQDAVKTAAAFDEQLGITGTILTMLDGDTRGGAAISIREVTGKPLVFEGMGEKIGDLQLFHPKSMADRILGMGDVVSLVEKAQDTIDEDVHLLSLADESRQRFVSDGRS